jgi:hypothetical protein
MFEFSAFGAVHTTVTLVTVLVDAIFFATYGRIFACSTSGASYILLTTLLAAINLPIFAHVGFGNPRALAIGTLLVIVFSASARSILLFQQYGPAVETVSYTSTYLFLLLSVVTDTITKLSTAHRLFANVAIPSLQTIISRMVIVFIGIS